jgi:hypothetical protein
MNTIKFLVVFVALAALGRADTTDRVSDRVIQLPPFVVTETRLPNPATDVRASLSEARAQVGNPALTQQLGRTIRRLATLRRTPPAAATSAAKPSV